MFLCLTLYPGLFGCIPQNSISLLQCTTDTVLHHILFCKCSCLTRIGSDNGFGVSGCHHAVAKAVKANLRISYEEHFEWKMKVNTTVSDLKHKQTVASQISTFMCLYSMLMGCDRWEKQSNKDSFCGLEWAAAVTLPVSFGIKVCTSWMASLSQLWVKQCTGNYSESHIRMRINFVLKCNKAQK